MARASAIDEKDNHGYSAVILCFSGAPWRIIHDDDRVK